MEEQILITSPKSEIIQVQQKVIDDYFSQNTKNSQTTFVKDDQKARSKNMKGTEKGQYFQVKHIIGCRKKKGKNANGQQEFQIEWENEQVTWELEQILNEDIPDMLHNYKQMNISKVNLNKDSSPQKPQWNTAYNDLDSIFLAYIGNWKKIKRQDNKDIYKCSECEARLEIEKKMQELKVKLINNTEPHNWCNKKHTEPFKNPEQETKIHSSVESFARQQVKQQQVYSPEQIIENLKLKRPQLFKFFKPSIDQLTILISILKKDLIINQTTPDAMNKRLTRSSKCATPQYSQLLDDSALKKRDIKEKIKKQQNVNINLSEKLVQEVLDEIKEIKIEQEEENKEEKKSIIKLSKKKREQEEQQEEEVQQSSKRVKFNQIVEQAEFEKLSSEDQLSVEMNEDNKLNQVDSSSLDEEFDQNEVGSDDEEMYSGYFMNMIKNEQIKACKERNYLIKELKAKERRGSIFIDEVDKVVAAVKRDNGKYDYLIEWKYNIEDKLVPTASIVRGSQFVFTKPLLFRRYIESNYIEKLKQSDKFAY